MRVARALASEITTIGLRLYELLKKEETNSKARDEAIKLLYNVTTKMPIDQRLIVLLVCRTNWTWRLWRQKFGRCQKQS